MKPFFTLLVCLILAWGGHLFGQNKGSLVIFYENESQFPDSLWEEIDSKMEAMQVDVVKKKASEGLPEEISLLPAIYFQNHLGRSLYKGRYLNLGRLTNFVRTSRYLPSQSAANPKEKLLLLQQGRATIGAPVKVTELSGKASKSFDQEGFQAAAIEALGTGMKQFQEVKSIDFPEQGRLFYFAVYPHRSGSKLYLNAEIYSMFNCKKAVFRTAKPVEGKWSQRWDLFRKLGAQIEQEILGLIQGSTVGDAFIPVAKDHAVKSWTALGLELPPPPKSAFQALPAGTKLPRKWVVDGPIAEDLPMVQFNFLAPMDYYAGEATELIGTLELPENRSLNGVKGEFKVPVASINMGDEMLTETAQKSKLLMEQFPEGSFVFDQGVGAAESLEKGQELQLVAYGQFMLKGIGVPLEVNAEIKALLNADGKVRLLVSTRYRITLEQNFDIHGPDGPKPASDTMEFSMTFFMKAAE